ncbi:MAG: preprotein translocase subunit SecG [Candidatus Eisenbacteria bacterium]|nr:preprotein translocase subunit SecG [Candidatus Eisenbacteria bacterium]
MFTLLIVIHLLVALALVISILLQRGEAGSLGGAFGGGGGSQSLFGGRGAATFLSKATAYLGGAFLVISFALALVQAHKSGAAVQEGGRNIIQQAVPQSPAPSQPEPGTMPQGAPEGQMPPAQEDESGPAPTQGQ